MFNVRDLVKQILAAGGAAFAAAFPAAALAGDYQAGKAAVLAGLAAAFAAAVGLVGTIVKQLVERARGIVARDSSELIEYLDAAETMIAQAKKVA
jgi:hypothetical protein